MSGPVSYIACSARSFPYISLLYLIHSSSWQLRPRTFVPWFEFGLFHRHGTYGCASTRFNEDVKSAEKVGVVLRHMNVSLRTNLASETFESDIVRRFIIPRARYIEDACSWTSILNYHVYVHPVTPITIVLHVSVVSSLFPSLNFLSRARR